MSISPIKRQQEIQSEEERKARLKEEEEEKRREQISLAYAIGKKLGIRSVTFHRNSYDENTFKEGIFEVDFLDRTCCRALEAKNIGKFSAFKTKILGLMGRVLFEIDQPEWDNFLNCCLMYQMKCGQNLFIGDALADWMVEAGLEKLE